MQFPEDPTSTVYTCLHLSLLCSSISSSFRPSEVWIHTTAPIQSAAKGHPVAGSSSGRDVDMPALDSELSGGLLDGTVVHHMEHRCGLA